MDFAHAIKLAKAFAHDFLDDGFVLLEAPDFDFFFEKLDEALSDETLEELLIVLRVADLGLKVMLGFLLNSLDHIEADLHLCHPALIDFSAFEDFLCDLDGVFHFAKGLFILLAGLTLDLVYPEVFLLVGLLVDSPDVGDLVVLDRCQEPIHAFLVDGVGILITLISHDIYQLKFLIKSLAIQRSSDVR